MLDLFDETRRGSTGDVGSPLYDLVRRPKRVRRMVRTGVLPVFLARESDLGVVYSAGDLAGAAFSEFDLLRTLDVLLGRHHTDTDPAPDPLLARTAELGDAHEQRMLDALIARHGDGVVQIDRPGGYSPPALRDAHRRTLDAIAAGADVIYQGAFYDGRFLGFCDFLIRHTDQDGNAEYAVYDTKLSRHARVPALLQLAAYADQLLAAGVRIAADAYLVLGDDTRTSHRVADIVPVYRHRRRRLEQILTEHLNQDEPVAWGDPRYSVNLRSDLVAAEVRNTRDPILVAGLSITQRARLRTAGISTLDQLAELSARTTVPGISGQALSRLRMQAGAQLTQERTGQPFYQVYQPDALAALPQPSAGDVFFDFEGDPLWAEDGSTDWGLEYLFGLVEAPDGSSTHSLHTQAVFRSFWAHDRAQERRALLGFLGYITERRRRFPDMHIYHYAPYEKTALLRLAGRHGVGEREVDELLRENVLIDLYPLVRKAIRVGAPSYSIKKLEPLYMGERLRGGEVTTAGDSIVEYARHTHLVEIGDHQQARQVLASIADYNRYDCDSTLYLRDWLAARAAEAGVPLRTREAVDTRQDEETFLDDPLETDLWAKLGDTPRAERTAVQQATAMVAAGLNYYRREHKPFWWAHYDRLAMPEDELAGAVDAFVPDTVEVVHEWGKQGKERSLRRFLRLAGELPTGSGIRVGQQVFAIFDPPVPDGVKQQDPTSRGAAEAVICTEQACVGRSIAFPDDGVIVEHTLPKGTPEYDAVPMALTPSGPPNAAILEAAIRRYAVQSAEAWPQMHPCAVADLLVRRPPRTRTGGGLPAVGEDTATAAITRACLEVDDSYVAVQGPPGTGKTFTGSKVIADLVLNHGWKVGVVAQSHSVVENMLDAVIDAHVPKARVVKKDNHIGSDKWTVLRDNKEYAKALDAAGTTGMVFGGTAWTFGSEKNFPTRSLDLLVIDEAGQFSLANTLAVAGAARNLLLLGDPCQLPQVSQGTHPEPVDASALGWLINHHGTLPAELGYFLERTYRMHPALCRAVSALAYDERLHSHEPETTGRLLHGVDPGVRTVYVDHQGNSTSSPEEAAAVLRQIQGLLGTPWRAKVGVPDTPLTPNDVIVVAPYNSQVHLIARVLDAAGLGDVRVGTVDKFQGRQAAVVIVSMTASAIDDVPRGMGFLLSRNRLNVAVSRGQWLAVLIRSRALTDYLPTTPQALEELGAFLGLCEAG